MIDRIIHLGFEVRVDLTLHDGSHFNVQLTQFEGGETKITA